MRYAYTRTHSTKHNTILFNNFLYTENCLYLYEMMRKRWSNYHIDFFLIKFLRSFYWRILWTMTQLDSIHFLLLFITKNLYICFQKMVHSEGNRLLFLGSREILRHDHLAELSIIKRKYESNWVPHKHKEILLKLKEMKKCLFCINFWVFNFYL